VVRFREIRGRQRLPDTYDTWVLERGTGKFNLGERAMQDIPRPTPVTSTTVEELMVVVSDFRACLAKPITL
jgi:hypothetical protein